MSGTLMALQARRLVHLRRRGSAVGASPSLLLSAPAAIVLLGPPAW